MGKWLKLILLAPILAISFGATAHAASTITKLEARTMSESKVKRRVLDQLGAILTEDPRPRRKHPVSVLTEMSFNTRPREIEVAGLCQLDRLTVTFEPQDRGPRDSGTPVMANGLSVVHYFHFAKAPTSGFEDLVDYDRRPNNAPCRGAKFWKDEFFYADNERTATTGYFVTHKAIDAIADGTSSFALTCHKFSPEADRDCADIMHELKKVPISSIRRCPANPAESASEGTQCFRVDIGVRSLRIVVDQSASVSKPRLTFKIVSVGMDSPRGP